MAARKRRLNRALLLVATPATLVIVGAFVLTLPLMRPAPPSELIISTGTADGSYHAYAMKYRDILARDGVTATSDPKRTDTISGSGHPTRG